MNNVLPLLLLCLQGISVFLVGMATLRLNSRLNALELQRPLLCPMKRKLLDSMRKAPYRAVQISACDLYEAAGCWIEDCRDCPNGALGDHTQKAIDALDKLPIKPPPTSRGQGPVKLPQ